MEYLKNVFNSTSVSGGTSPSMSKFTKATKANAARHSSRPRTPKIAVTIGALFRSHQVPQCKHTAQALPMATPINNAMM
jgi:hypothetical protein